MDGKEGIREENSCSLSVVLDGLGQQQQSPQ